MTQGPLLALGVANSVLLLSDVVSLSIRLCYFSECGEDPLQMLLDPLASSFPLSYYLNAAKKPLIENATHNPYIPQPSQYLKPSVQHYPRIPLSLLFTLAFVYFFGPVGRDIYFPHLVTSSLRHCS